MAACAAVHRGGRRLIRREIGRERPSQLDRVDKADVELEGQAKDRPPPTFLGGEGFQDSGSGCLTQSDVEVMRREAREALELFARTLLSERGSRVRSASPASRVKALQALSASGHGLGSSSGNRAALRDGPRDRSPEALLMPLLGLSLKSMRDDLERGGRCSPVRRIPTGERHESGQGTSVNEAALHQTMDPTGLASDAIALAYAVSKLDILVSSDQVYFSSSPRPSGFHT